ncbi:hypothetical protein E0Z10_g6378 [Xylaria hypoxylon]|uniref:Major facilitator superfamily (MFS) profile domain-containing protein n=1 Tax=Xylaria hypoxylon TaxID=37992 RepID=A0A4Z0YTD1_9PEZI|nr:hypothetical protein E0Z10_g6378 [Xylaria hypoxylon]
MASSEKCDEPTSNAVGVPLPHDYVPDTESRKGGFVAWLQVVGAFCVYLNTWGMLNSFGVFQTYYELDALSSQSSFVVGWIGSTQSALFFIATLIVGPLFDLGYFRSLLWVGTALIVISMFLLSVTSQFYQVLLTQSVLFGFGAGCVFLPAPAVVAQHFDARLGLAICIASVGSAVTSVGFGWATRVIAFVLLGTSLLIILMKSKTKPTASRSVLDWAAFTDLPYMLLNVGLVFGFMGLYIVINYFQLYALARTNISANLADNLLIIINSGSLVVALVATILAFSLLAVHTSAALLIVAVLFGIASGTFLGLPVASIVRLSDDPNKIGTRIGMTLLFVGIGALISYPIAGAIIGDGDNWLGLILFSGLLLAISTIILATSRFTKVDRQWTKPL